MKKISVFLSSPGDVERERQMVEAVIAQLNRMLGEYLDITLELKQWKTHVIPDMGRAQEIINKQIGKYDIFLGIMWKRFGTPTGKAESGTEEEFNIAYRNWQRYRRPHILFYFSQAPYTPQDSAEIEQWGKVFKFKQEYWEKGLCYEYPSPEAFADLLREHLAKILQQWFAPKGEQPLITDFTRYLKSLRSDTMYMDIRGLVSGESTGYQFRIDELYIPLQTSRVDMHSKTARKKEEHLQQRDVPLEEALREQRLLIRGDPGAGKTTFLRLIAFALCQRWLGETSSASLVDLLYPKNPPLPIWVSLGRLADYVRREQTSPATECPPEPDSPEWLCHYLKKENREFSWNLPEEVFRCELNAGHCLILFDGLDEAPDSTAREQISALAANIIKAFPECRMVITSRPAALVGEAIPRGFTEVEIAPLTDEAIEIFLKKWSTALYPKAAEKAAAHLKELGEALKAKSEIRRMARNPVMLTALAVVHWNENRLPEQRSELYESILTWLFRARAREGRLKADRCRKLLQKLAFAMFTHADGRQRQVGVRV
ncbi:NACHT domain-containing protein, partial [candidate division KSB1 bacterium]|nr:NACHT domain-containing protein [candidate division KSB1 bacterium]